MKRKLVLFLSIIALFLLLLSGCAYDTNPDVTTKNETNQVEISQCTTVPSDETVNPALNVDELSYIQFNALSFEDKQRVMESFDTYEDFVKWRDELKKVHEEFTEKVNAGNTEQPEQPDQTDQTGETEEPDQNTTASTDPTVENTADDTTAPTETEPESKKVTFLEYQAMSGVEQKKFINSFESIDAFMAWHAAAVKEHKENMPEFGHGMTVTYPTDITEPTETEN